MLNVILYSCSIIIGFLMLVKGSDYFVDGAASFAARVKIPQRVIGLTIVAMGTSAPEAAVSITAAFTGNADISIGNIVGSNILNIFIILGIALVIVPIFVSRSTIKIEIPYMIVCSVLLLLLGYDGKMGLLDGIILWLMFILYLIYLFLCARNNKESGEQMEYVNGWKQIIYVVGGLASIIIGSRFAVYGVSEIAQMIGISERFIGLTIVALGTSLPELFTSVTAAKKGNADIAMGNIVGSNIFNILFVVGTTAIVTVVPFDRKFLVDSIVVISSGVLLLLCVCFKKKLGRVCGALLLLCYGVYFAYLCFT